MRHEHKSFLRPVARNGRFRSGGESGSFSAAARKLGTSPSAVSRSVAKLEQALALQLLHRTTRKLRLSESGEEAFAHCRTLLAAADAVMAIGGRGAVEPEGLVSVSVPKAVGRFVLHPHMPEFRAATRRWT